MGDERAVEPMAEGRRGRRGWFVLKGGPPGMAALAVVLLALVGCAEPWPGQSLVGYPQLREEVRQRYERDAWERSATCVQPLMTGILRAEIVEQTEGRMVVLVRYAWRDQVSDDDPPFVGCNGIAERRFTVDTRGDIARVIGMDGEQRPPRRSAARS